MTEIEALFELFSDPTKEAFDKIQNEFKGKSVEEKQRFDKISEFYFKHFVSPYGVAGAEESFVSILREAMIENERNSVLDLEKFEELCGLYQQFKEIFGDGTKMNFYPAFASGAIVVRVSDVCLTVTKVKELKAVLERVNTFEVCPLLNGNLDVGVTLKVLFIDKADNG